MKVGFIGLGNMGSRMAANLVRAGHELTIYNRTKSRAEQLRKIGARVASTPSEAAQSAEAVVTMLSDDAAVEQVVTGPDGFANSLTPGSIHVSMSTISVALSEHLSTLHGGKKQGFVAAPVFGRPEAAEAAKLFVVAAGVKQSFDRVEPLLAAVGQKTFYFGEQPSAANIVKLSGNFLIASMIECLGEAFALVRKHGVSPDAYFDVLTSSLFSAPIYRTYGGIIAQDKYESVGFRLALGLKDVKLALQAADNKAVPMPVASLVHDRFLTGVANGEADQDWSFLARMAAESAGLKPHS